MPSEVLRTFENWRLEGNGVSFPGYRAPHPSESFTIQPRGAARVSLRAGDMVTLSGQCSGIRPALVSFDESGGQVIGKMTSASVEKLSCDLFHSPPLAGWMAAQGGVLDGHIDAVHLPELSEPLILRAPGPMSLWVIAAIPVEAMVTGEASGVLNVRVKRADVGARILPEPLGEIRDEFTVSRGTAQAYQLRKGEVVQVIDVEGQQCSDFMALREDALQQGVERMIDSTVTRTIVGGAYPRPGLFDQFFDRDMRPLLALEHDTVGRHDTFALACTARNYEEKGFPGHVNCSDNISAELAPYGVETRPAWPAINFFFNSWIDRSDNHLQSAEAWSRAGDYVALRARDNLVCVSTACPDDIDPINGWNPTDVHVRIYRPEAPIRRAVAYREKENAVPIISEESVFHPRTSKLTKNFAPARNLWTPGHYSATGALEEYWACRNAVTLQDMSGLRKYDIKGPDAQPLLQIAMTRSLAKLAVFRGVYSLLCDETGTVIDDGTLFRLAPELFRWCCGSEESARWLTKLAEERGFRVRIEAMGGALPNLALQGPASRDVLRRIVHTSVHVPDLDNLKWFGATIGRLHDREGPVFMLTRSGFTGELGYELFFGQSDALAIWDALMEAGEEFGITPMGAEALEIMRIEAGLMTAGAEFAPGVDAFEAGLGFAVNLKKPEFVGKEALERASTAPRNLLVGLLFDGGDTPHHGDPVLVGERQIGVVTSATRSPTLRRPIAMARVAVEYSEEGTKVDVGQLDGKMKRLSATTTTIPFVDPERKRPRA